MISTMNRLTVARFFLFNKLVSNIAKSIQIFYDFFGNNEKLKIWTFYMIWFCYIWHEFTQFTKKKKPGNSQLIRSAYLKYILLCLRKFSVLSDKRTLNLSTFTTWKYNYIVHQSLSGTYIRLAMVEKDKL